MTPSNQSALELILGITSVHNAVNWLRRHNLDHAIEAMERANEPILEVILWLRSESKGVVRDAVMQTLDRIIKSSSKDWVYSGASPAQKQLINILAEYVVLVRELEHNAYTKRDRHATEKDMSDNTPCSQPVDALSWEYEKVGQHEERGKTYPHRLDTNPFNKKRSCSPSFRATDSIYKKRTVSNDRQITNYWDSSNPPKPTGSFDLHYFLSKEYSDHYFPPECRQSAKAFGKCPLRENETETEAEVEVEEFDVSTITNPVTDGADFLVPESGSDEYLCSAPSRSTPASVPAKHSHLPRDLSAEDARDVLDGDATKDLVAGRDSQGEMDFLTARGERRIQDTRILQEREQQDIPNPYPFTTTRQDSRIPAPPPTSAPLRT